jgi:general secretion pathway protein K
MSAQRQRGVALITALLVVALAAAAAAAMATRQQIDVRRTANLLHSEQAYAYVLGAESWARVVLERDAAESQVDKLDEDWATQIPASIVEGGTVAGRIIDMQGRFNLNSLAPGGVAEPAAIERYKRLLRLLDLEDTLADPLVDWIDADINARFPDGAEDETYLLLQPAYRVANRPLVSVSELRLVKGYESEVVARLQPFVTALPEATPVNINTASAEVLAALAANLSVSDGEALIEARDKEGYTDAAGFLREPVFAGQAVDGDAVSVNSQWFLLVGEANIGQGRARLASLIQRTAQGTRTVRREREFIEAVIAPQAQADQQ